MSARATRTTYEVRGHPLTDERQRHMGDTARRRLKTNLLPFTSICDLLVLYQWAITCSATPATAVIKLAAPLAGQEDEQRWSAHTSPDSEERCIVAARPLSSLSRR